MEQKRSLKKLIIGGLVAVAIGLIIMGISMAFFTPKLPTNPLSLPTNLRVVETSTGQKELCVDTCQDPNSTGYTFIIVSESLGRVIAKSQSPKLSVTTLLSKPEAYRIFCQYTAKQIGNNSDFVELVYYSTTRLAPPSLSLGTGQHKNKLYFSSNNFFEKDVSLGVQLVYMDGDETKTSAVYYETTNNGRGVMTGYFDLSSIITTSGEFRFYAKIFAFDNPYILPSELSQSVVYTVE